MKYNFLWDQYEQETKDWHEKEKKLQNEKQELLNKNLELNEQVNWLHQKVEDLQT